MTEPILVPLAELVRRSSMHRTTIYRWLKRKGINTERRGVLMGEVATKWPELYETLKLSAGESRGCPVCGPETPCRCVVCGRRVA